MNLDNARALKATLLGDTMKTLGGARCDSRDGSPRAVC